MRPWLLCAVLGSAAWAQTGAVPAQPPAEQENEPPSSQLSPQIPMDAAVLTIKGFCPEQKPGSDAACQTVITRAQFEAIAGAIQPTMNPVVKRQLASLLPRLLVMTHAAEVRGLDREPQYEQ